MRTKETSVKLFDSASRILQLSEILGSPVLRMEAVELLALVLLNHEESLESLRQRNREIRDVNRRLEELLCVFQRS